MILKRINDRFIKYFNMSFIEIYVIILIQFNVSSKSQYLPESLIESTIVLSMEETLTPRISSTKSVEVALLKEKLFPSN